MTAPSGIILVAALTLSAGSALAQSTSLPGVPPAPVITVPAATCSRPPTTAGLNPTTPESKRWNKQIEDYKKCMVDYQKALGDAANAYVADANLLIDAGKKTTADFNAYAQQVRKDNDMDDDDDAGKK